MMLSPKLSSASILSLVALLAAAGDASAAASNYDILAKSSNNGEERSLQASAGCLLGQKPFEECCPAADPDDGICTMLWCVDLKDVTVKDNCSCDQVKAACGQVVANQMFVMAVSGLKEMCASVESCCTDTAATNDEYNTCMTSAGERGEYAKPNFDTLLPGGIPDLAVSKETLPGASGGGTVHDKTSGEKNYGDDAGADKATDGTNGAPIGVAAIAHVIIGLFAMIRF